MSSNPVLRFANRAARRLRRTIRETRGRWKLTQTSFVPTPFGELSAPGWSPAIRQMCLGAWEPLQTAVVRGLVPNRVYWDLGAHIGLYVLAANQAGARRIYAVEAAPITFQHLTKTTQRAAIQATLLNAALVASETDSTVDFFVGAGPDGLLYSSTNPVYGDFEVVRVPASTIGSLVSREGWEAPGAIKIDLEGAEPWIVPQILERFSESKPDLIVEVNFEACAAGGTFPYCFLEQLMSARDVVLVIDEAQDRVRRLKDPRHVRHADNVAALSNDSLERLRAVLPEAAFAEL